MAKDASDGVLNAPLTLISGFTRMTVCSAQPTSIADIATVALADATLDAGDFAIAANDGGTGRMVTIGAQTAVPVDTTGTPTHITLDNGTEWITTTCSGPGLTSGSTVNVPAFKVRMPEPV